MGRPIEANDQSQSGSEFTLGEQQEMMGLMAFLTVEGDVAAAKNTFDVLVRGQEGRTDEKIRAELTEILHGQSSKTMYLSERRARARVLCAELWNKNPQELAEDDLAAIEEVLMGGLDGISQLNGAVDNWRPNYLTIADETAVGKGTLHDLNEREVDAD
jgi:hypothetical protein